MKWSFTLCLAKVKQRQVLWSFSFLFRLRSASIAAAFLIPYRFTFSVPSLGKYYRLYLHNPWTVRDTSDCICNHTPWQQVQQLISVHTLPPYGWWYNVRVQASLRYIFKLDHHTHVLSEALLYSYRFKDYHLENWKTAVYMYHNSLLCLKQGSNKQLSWLVIYLLRVCPINYFVCMSVK